MVTKFSSLLGSAGDVSTISSGVNSIPSTTGYLATYPYGYGQGSAGIVTSNPYTPVTYYDSNMYPFKLRPVENGWILVKDNKEYVLHTPEEIVKYLETSKS